MKNKIKNKEYNKIKNKEYNKTNKVINLINLILCQKYVIILKIKFNYF